MKKSEELRRIRREIARLNGIVYLSAPCTEEDCGGKCAACQAEARFLEDELNRKTERGERILISGLFLSEEEKIPEGAAVTEVPSGQDAASEENSGGEEELNLPVEEMLLSATVLGILKRSGISAAGQLCSITPGQAADLGRLGMEGYQEIRAAMALLNLETDPLLERSVLYEKERREILNSYFE